MKLIKLIEAADKAYDPDNLVLRSFQGEDVGDGLAGFIARELRDIYDPKASDKAQIVEAFRAIARAKAQLEAVCSAIDLIETKGTL